MFEINLELIAIRNHNYSCEKFNAVYKYIFSKIFISK